MGGGAGGGAPIQNNLVIAIIGTVLGLCCNICLLPVGSVPGIIGIVFASQVNKLVAAGDIAGAQAKAKNAKILGLVSIGLGVVGIVFYVIWIAVNGTYSWNFSSSN